MKEDKELYSSRFAYLDKEVEIVNELKICLDHEFIPCLIKRLENENSSVIDQINILREAESDIRNDILQQYFAELIKKCSDLTFFYSLDHVTSSAHEKQYLYVPLTTCYAERSFSSLKYILNDRRTNLSIETLGSILSAYFNKFD